MMWVWLTVFAALMQSIRTAGQKSLARTVSPMAATLVRYLFGLPFALMYLLILIGWQADSLQTSLNYSRIFFLYSSAAAIMQIVATVCLVSVMHSRNFAVGTAYAKTEAVLSAVLAAVLFQVVLSGFAWLSIVGGVAGVLLLSLPGARIKKLKFRLDRSVVLGLLSGLFFALTALFLRQASLSLAGPVFLSAAVTLVYMVGLQTILTGLWIVWTDPLQLSLVARHWRIALFVGATSVLGSIGWFTAMTLQQVPYVKALGQIEFLFTLLITGRVFRESISSQEMIGMGLIVLSVCVLLLV